MSSNAKIKPYPRPAGGLTRLRGFDTEISDFEIFLASTWLILFDHELPLCLKTAVVKTYPVYTSPVS
jgi:hypothetical protein